MHELFTTAELDEMRQTFKYGSYTSTGDQDQPIIRKNILRKIEEALMIKSQLKRSLTNEKIY